MRPIIAALASVLLLAACAEDNIRATDIVTRIPWPDEERATYRVLDDDGEEVGALVMTVASERSDTYLLGQSFSFPEAGFTNEAEVTVARADLQPRRTTYVIDGPDGVASCTALYEGSDVIVTNVREDGELTDTLDVPNIAYDSWSDLFIWRTINFSQGFDIEYADIVACQAPAPPQRLAVKLEVTGGETIEVPAGTFDTWRVEIDAGRDQKAWFTTDDAHILVRYDNGDQIFELIEYSGNGSLTWRVGVGLGIGVASPPTSAMHSTNITNAARIASTSQATRTIPSLTDRLLEVVSYKPIIGS
ncbi:MAG: DUF3108 domain-containing protein [Chloroflexi bacterium]|nr:DUF3108 domain-containing protein [Chloroflexota bacterium]